MILYHRVFHHFWLRRSSIQVVCFIKRLAILLLGQSLSDLYKKNKKIICWYGILCHQEIKRIWKHKCASSVIFEWKAFYQCKKNEVFHLLQKSFTENLIFCTMDCTGRSENNFLWWYTITETYCDFLWSVIIFSHAYSNQECII